MQKAFTKAMTHPADCGLQIGYPLKRSASQMLDN